MTQLIDELENLKALDNASAADKRRRGFAFEKLLKRLLESESLSPRIRVRPSGEEIDGSICLNDRFFLIEAKWHAEPLPASSIYAFKGKVDGKLTGTVGIFISVSGYSEDAIDALTAGKNVNVILFDGDDIEAAFTHSFRDVLLPKLRAAAEEGVVFYPYTSTLATVDDAQSQIAVGVPTDEIPAGSKQKQIIVVCEGQSDVLFLSHLGQRILTAENLDGQIRFVAAQGKHGIPRLVNAIQPMFAADTSIIVVVDGDNEATETRTKIQAEATVPIAGLVVIDPEIEVWAAPGVNHPKAKLLSLARDANQPFHTYFHDLMAAIPIDQLRTTDASFAAFYDAIVAAAKTDA